MGKMRHGIIWSTTTLTAIGQPVCYGFNHEYTSGVDYMVWARVYDNAGNISTIRQHDKRQYRGHNSAGIPVTRTHM